METPPVPSEGWQSAPAVTLIPPPGPPSEPRTRDELQSAFANPLRAVDVVLATPDRSRANLEARSELARLVLLFLFVAALWSIPFGLVLGVEAWWKLSVLTLGSVAICLPSLHVFGAFLGLRTTPMTITALASTLPATAALFTAGFAPILAFLRYTFDPKSDGVTWIVLAKCLIAAALFAGAIQLVRTLPRTRDRHEVVLALLMPGWLVVFTYVLVRMARVIELFP